MLASGKRWTCYLQPPAASTVPSSVSLPTSRPLIGRTVPESLETLLGCRELVEPEACSCFNIAINLNGWTILQSMPLDLPLPTTEKPICQEKGKSHLGLVWPPFLPWDFSLFESFIYVVLPCCYLAAQSKIHELWKNSLKGSPSRVVLPQWHCPKMVVDVPLERQHLDSCGPMTNVGHGPCASHTCVGKCFISSQGTATKDDAIMLPRSQFGTSSSWFHNVCTWIDCLLLLFFLLGTFKQLAIL